MRRGARIDCRDDGAPRFQAMNEHDLLIRLARAPCSGSELARESGLTRAAVWKRIQALREAGIEILARPGSGYALAAPLDLLDAASIRAGLSADAARELESCEVAWRIDSTNAELLRR